MINKLLVWQLVDSGLPTGGFVASSGLESAIKHSVITDSAQLDHFIRACLHSFAHSAVPIALRVHSHLSAFAGATGTAPSTNTIHQLDQLYDASLAGNHLMRQSSRAQGQSLLTLLLKSFSQLLAPPQLQWCRQYKRSIVCAIATEGVGAFGNLPVAMGIVCAMLSIDATEMAAMLLMNCARSIISAAVRLNSAGPYEGQTILCSLLPFIDGLVNNCCATATVPPTAVFSTSPLVDICQGMHGKLYSRLFNS
jgi:urease accessory protein